jgi:hypothetical protein
VVSILIKECKEIYVFENLKEKRLKIKGQSEVKSYGKNLLHMLCLICFIVQFELERNYWNTMSFTSVSKAYLGFGICY